MIEEVLPDGSRIHLVTTDRGLDLPADEWSDWGERLPLEQTVGSLGRALVLPSTGEPPADVHAAAVADLSWHRVSYGPNAGSQAWNFGITVRPELRGRGIGTAAQRLLARHLFATTAVHRVEASTDVRNLAEQKALERAGFRREGVLRGAQLRGGEYHDIVEYAILRTDAPVG